MQVQRHDDTSLKNTCSLDRCVHDRPFDERLQRGKER
jgi:hypothetical protein